MIITYSVLSLCHLLDNKSLLANGLRSVKSESETQGFLVLTLVTYLVNSSVRYQIKHFIYTR